MTAEEFVRRVMEELSVESPAALADALGWPRGKERTVARWLAGETKPSYMNVIEMVERAGLLNTSEERRTVRSAPRSRLEALADNDESILENQKSAMGVLEEIHAAVASLLAAQHTSPRQKKTP